MQINYLLGLPTFLMIIGLAWATQSHAGWGNRDYEDENDLPEVESFLPEASERSSFDLGSAEGGSGNNRSANSRENNLLELFQKFDAMQQEVQELRGRVEAQEYQIQSLMTQQRQAQHAPAAASTQSGSNASSGAARSGFSFTPSSKPEGS